MASVRGGGGDIKAFYRQRKKNNNTKPSKPSKSGVRLDSDPAQPPALLSHGSIDIKRDFDQCEEVLRRFDMNMSYGPCIGLTRLERWERANKLGMNPPKDVETLLKGGNAGLDCLWEGRV
ncbi:DNA polymerase delta subunit 4 [Amborella trichopoda]|uniref:DNA polymerase delta subunit 4 n=1 Tax=Amborella trichopoda TaxID=13333 RepID=W1NH63_AMBTC|nr:DNA polymerase delta subunit 4 [Amborella trichopoda]ERM94801.1 hypothetical protein AMTR_s00011p00265890 [Amborella trichopoda]|eukprot:XP_006878656.1 DNA polymerase delta subunit 4 [Amborella trichopoda]